MERPLVYINMAMTADGKITSARREYPRFTSTHDRTRMDRLRAQADAIMVGAGTMRADNPKLHVREPEMREYRRSLGKRDALVKVIVTASAALDAGCRFFDETDGGTRIVATVDDAPDENIAALDGKAEIWRLGPGRVELDELLRRLRKRGVERLLVEGGSELNWGLLRDDLVDDLYLTVAPSLLGGREAPTPIGGEGFPMHLQKRLRLAEVDREGDELFCHYEIRR